MAITFDVSTLSSPILSNLGRVQQTSQTLVRRLSSGMRINQASDDAAGLAMSERLRATVRSLSRAERNVNDGVSLAQTAEGALSEIHTMLSRMRELAVQAASGSLSAVDRSAIDTEFQHLKGEIDRTARATEFKGRKLIDGSLAASSSFNQKSLLTDGVDEFLVVANHPTINFTDGMTVSMWLKPESYPWSSSSGDSSETPLIVKAGNGDARGIYSLTMDSQGRVRFVTNGGTFKETEQSDALELNQWHHVVGVWDKQENQLRLFVNGELASTVDAGGTTALISPEVLTMARRTHSHWGHYYDGHMDEVSLWSSALAGDDVERIYGQGVPTDLSLDPHSASVASWWRMGAELADDATGTTGTIHDHVGTTNGTPSNTEATDIVLDAPVGAGLSNTMSMQFDGVDESVALGSAGGAGDIQGRKNTSVSTWFKVSGLGSAVTQRTIYGSAAQHELNIARDKEGGPITLKAHLVVGGGTIKLNARTELEQDKWYHAVLTYDAADRAKGARLYLNGREEAVRGANGKLAPGTAAPTLGQRGDEPNPDVHQFWSGNIDEASVWSKTLDSAEISMLYSDGSPTPLLGLDGLLGWWRLGEGLQDSTDLSASPKIYDHMGKNHASPVNTEAGDLVDDVPTGEMTFQVGIGTGDGDQLKLSVDSATSSDLGLANLTTGSAKGAKTAITFIDSAIGSISQNRSRLGATINRFEVAASGIRRGRTAADASLSVIRDADIAETTAEYSRTMLRQKAGAAILVQANLQASLVLALLK